MRCPKCGNEVSQDEAFCGQCGTPTRPLPQRTEMVQAPRSGLLQTYNQNNSPTPEVAPDAYGTSPIPPASAYNPNMPPFQGGSMAPPNQTPIITPSDPRQQTDFYQDATEAMSSLPPNAGQSYPANYPPQSYGGAPLQAGYPGTGQYGSSPQGQLYQAGNQVQPGYSSVPPYAGGQNYTGYPPQPGLTPPPIKKQNNTALIIVITLLVLALIAVIFFGTLYLLRGHSAPKPTVTPTPIPTIAPTSTPTSNPTPTATSNPTPSPTATPAPDANFSWCDVSCTNNGFIVEYPNGWNQGQTSDKTGVQFLNPTQQDQYAAFKVPTIQGEANASNLVDADLQSVYASKTGYTAPTSKLVTTIGGETWTYAIAYYQLNGQKERVEVFATIHAKKGYVIELQAADSQFDAVNTQYFSIMIARFQFLSSTS
ncbi:MAG: zinc-ribbon domain-containing protein [Chloroflexi bacterium]|nr:MAG: zinc-ribbon domain-containing protein [Chloroflexota bacterium]TMD43074.1 MAG: zinc-ribbon domain-containing protein [Chloroflexota bacterium]